MRLSLVLAALLCACATQVPAKIFLCGDSTMANDGYKGLGSEQYVGWGAFLQEALTTRGVQTTVINNAIGGRSARTYYTEGRFNKTAASLSQGDTVVISFGW